MSSNKGKPPTKTDRTILEFLQGGGMVNWKTAFEKFGTNRLTDNIYRLRQAGYVIHDIEVRYINGLGQHKHYFNYTMKQPEILKAGAKTEVNYAKLGKTATDYANDLITSAQNHGAVQGEIFGDYQKVLRT